uniref:Cationic amino acid transporter C-terminal domain-containing protein n=1 Tax=Ciona savignyi TaxID=51511 RepID=H2YW56_CIOSA
DSDDSDTQYAETGRNKITKTLKLRRNIDVFSGVLVASGVMLGSGIFVSANTVLDAANNSLGVTLLIWVFGGAVAVMSTLCYCELATSISESGSDYTYLSHAYTPAFGFLLPWMSTFVPCSDTATILTFARYALAPSFSCSAPSENSVKLTAICLLLFITAINILGVKFAVRLQVLLSWSKFVAVGAVVISAVVYVIRDSSIASQNLNHAFETKALSGITLLTLSSSFYQVMYSYDGWNALCHVTEEVKEPEKTIPKASIAAVSIITLIYVTMNLAYFAVLTPEEISTSKIIALPFALKAMGGASWIVPLSVCLCAVSSYSAGILTHGRLPYVAARRGQLPMIFGMLHINSRVPSPALVLNALSTIVLINIGNLEMMIDTFGFVNWTFKGFSSLSVLILRKRMPHLKRPYKVPTIIPIFMFILSSVFVILPLINQPHFLYFYAIFFFAVGLCLYYIFVHKQCEMPGSARVTRVLQKLFQVAPCDWKK